MRMYNPVNGLLSTGEAARHLGISGTYMRFLCQVGDIPSQTVGRRYVFKVSDLDAWNEKRTAKRAWRTIHNAEKQAAR